MEKRERSENWNSQLTFTSSMKLFDILNRYWHMALIFKKKKKLLYNKYRRQETWNRVQYTLMEPLVCL